MTDRATRIPLTSSILLLLGLFLLGISWAVPVAWWERRSWTLVDAEAYSEASLDVHMKSGVKRERPNDPRASEDLQLAQQRLAQLGERVQHAQTPRRRWRIAVRLVGLSLCVIGALLHRSGAEIARS